jgi:hypothetical protein
MFYNSSKYSHFNVLKKRGGFIFHFQELEFDKKFKFLLCVPSAVTSTLKYFFFFMIGGIEWQLN